MPARYLNAEAGKRIQTCDIITRVNAPVSVKQIQWVRAMAYEIRRGRRLDSQGG